jgi:hypothetical protein
MLLAMNQPQLSAIGSLVDYRIEVVATDCSDSV